VELDFVSVPVGGVMDLMVGETYTISIDASTATQGYEQIESFIHFPNTIFQVLAVTTQYSADSSPHVLNPNDKLYADSCLWENDPDNPNYRSCLDVGKNGGTVRVDYVVKIIGGAGTSDTLNSLIYDFSGSSYHYNADFSVAYRTYNIIGPSSIEIAKRFVPDSIVTGDDSTLTITLTNPTSTTIEGVKFDDPLPGGMTIASPVISSTTGCGSPTFAPVGGAGTFSFSDGTIGPSSSCLIKVDVTVAADGAYENTTGNLFINDTVDTGNNATATLTAGAGAACSPGQTMAVWTVPPTTTDPPDQSAPVAGSPTTTGSKISTATLAATDPTNTAIFTTSGVGDTYSWELWGFKTPVQHVDFVIDTSSYSEVSMEFYERADGNGPDTLTIFYDNGSGITAHPTTPTIIPSVVGFIAHTVDFTGLTDPGGNTTFRISGTGAQNDQSGANLWLDQITFTGCLESDPPPTLTKSFGTDPVKVNVEESTLTFSIANADAAAVDLTGIKFSDALPAGLEVSSTPDASTTCPGSPTWSPASGDTTLTFGDPGGLTLTAGSSCTASVDIIATAAGFFENISGYISADQSGENQTSSGYAVDSLTALVPPVISKDFADTVILVGDTTSLRFTIANLNQFTALTGVTFTDTLPGGLDAVSPGVSAVCGGSLTVADSNPDSISLSAGTIPAAGSCTFVVPVSGSNPGQQDNVTGAVVSTEGGTGNTASASIFVKTPTPDLNILKQIGFGSDPDGSWAKSLRIDSLPDDVYYKFIVENVGDVDLTSIRVFDPPSDYPASPVACTFYEPTVPATLFVEPLQPGEYVYCVTAPVTVSDPGSNTNTAVAYGTYSAVDYVSDPASTAYYGTPAITLAKSAAEDYFDVVGDSLNYSYLVINSGYVDLEGPVTVADDTVSVTCPDLTTVGDNDNYLDVGESLTCTASYTVDQDDLDAGDVTNTATASVDSVTSAVDSVTVPYAAYSISKTVLDVGGDGAGGSVDAAGDEIDYRVVVTNTGNYALTGISLGDTLVAGVGLPAESGTADNILEVGETWTWEYSYTALQADLDNNGGGDGDIDNIAFVSSTQLAAQSASAAVSMAQSASLTVVKSGTLNDDDGTPGVSPGDTISYVFTVANTGNVTLTNVTVSDPQVSVSGGPTTLDVGETDNTTFTGSYTITQADIDAGQFVNTATADSDESGPDTDQETTNLAQSASLTVEKSSTTAGLDTPAIVTYNYLVTNTGNVTITGLSLSDDNDEDDLNCALSVIPVGSTTTCTATHDFTQAELDANGSPVAGSGFLSNSVTASSNEAPDATDSLEIPITYIFDPPYGIKTFDAAGLPVLEWTMVWINNANSAALDVIITDPIPAGTTYRPGTISCDARGSSIPAPVTCTYDGFTNSIRWEGSIGPDLGATSEADADNEVVITFQVDIPSNVVSAENTAVLDADLNRNGVIDPSTEEIEAAQATARWERLVLPDTGFMAGAETNLPAQPAEKHYQQLGPVWLEIPRLGIRTSIVGVPLTEGSWDVTWLANQVGWLEGSAFPSYNGNSVLTAHVYLPSGYPGPFVDLSQLRWDDQIIVHLYGQQYLYRVRNTQIIRPDNPQAFQPENLSWLTLLTCRGYNEETGSYSYRVMVKAVLIEVRPDFWH
jgi:LPXTG-site transpeptidase (sortase) family protein